MTDTESLKYSEASGQDPFMMKREKFWKVFWTITLFAAGAVHFGTAAFRIQSFNYLDFSSYYVAATASRLDISPYPFSAELLASVAETHDSNRKESTEVDKK